jgi:hypothetical protein
MVQEASSSAPPNILCYYWFSGLERRGFQRLVKITNQVVNALQTHRETDEIRRGSRLLLLHGINWERVVLAG